MMLSGKWTVLPAALLAAGLMFARANGADGFAIRVEAPGPNKPATGGGSARVALLDAQGKAFPGFSADECEVIQDDAIDFEVRWKNGPDVSALNGQSVSVHVAMRNAKLYALQFGRANAA